MEAFNIFLIYEPCSRLSSLRLTGDRRKSFRVWPRPWTTPVLPGTARQGMCASGASV